LLENINEGEKKIRLKKEKKRRKNKREKKIMHDNINYLFLKE